MSIAAKKRKTRRAIKRRLAEISPEEMASRSALTCEHILRLPEYRESTMIMAYLSMDGELDPKAVLEQAHRDGKQTAVPVIDWDRHIMQAALYTPASPLKTVRYGLSEPKNRHLIDPPDIDLILVPGLGFGPSGQRLGRGGGFYDRFLDIVTKETILCAISFETQHQDELPTETHDITMDLLVTETGVRRFTV